MDIASPDFFHDRLSRTKGAETRTVFQELDLLLSSPAYTPHRAVQLLLQEPELAPLYTLQAVREGYSVAEHSCMKLCQLEKYCTDIEFPGGVPMRVARFIDLLHDAGKRVSNDTREQHLHTAALLHRLRGELPLSDHEFGIAVGLITSNTIGTFIIKATKAGSPIDRKMHLARKYREEGCLHMEDLGALAASISLAPDSEIEAHAETAARAIAGLAREIGVPVVDFFAMQTLYYQLDASCYTFDAPRSDEPAWRALEDRSIIPNFGGIAADTNIARDIVAFFWNLESKGAIPRAYPSLDGLFAWNPGFEPRAHPMESRMLIMEKAQRRLRFSPPVEHAYRYLQHAVKDLSEASSPAPAD